MSLWVAYLNPLIPVTMELLGKSDAKFYAFLF